VNTYNIDVVVMGDDRTGSDRFDYLKDHCELVLLPSTDGIATTEVKVDLANGRDMLLTEPDPESSAPRESEASLT